MTRPRWSLAGQVAAVAIGSALLAVAVQTVVAARLESAALGWAAALAAAGCFAAWGALRIVHPWAERIRAVTHGIESLRDGDLSISIATGSEHEIDPLVQSYNTLGDALRRQRQDLHNRELLLDTVIQATPLAMLLMNSRDQIVFSNFAARTMLNGGRLLEGLHLQDLLRELPASLRDAVAARGDGLFTIETAGESEVFHITQRQFNLHAQPHQLLLLKPLTRELAAQEVATWKKVIRVIAHELNNSLAPISSLAHSGAQLARQPDAAALERVFATIEERARHLTGFIDGYARFAKLPRPRPERVDWLHALELVRSDPRIQIHCARGQENGWFDRAQLQQVLINLIKNAVESGSAPEQIEIRVERDGTNQRLSISDRGPGFSDEALQSALLPFFSTKASGTGLGLTLCREIVEAHGGRMSVSNRPGGGAQVTLWLPQGVDPHPGS